MSYVGRLYIEPRETNWQHLGEGVTQALPGRIISGFMDLIFAGPKRYAQERIYGVDSDNPHDWLGRGVLCWFDHLHH